MIDNFGLSDNAVKIFKDLYSFQEENIEDTFKRVSREFATNKEEEDLAFKLLSEGYWRPNTPVFLNAGTKHKVFSACYVVGLEDSMDSIYDVANVCRKIFQYGAGVGIPIGNLREKQAWIYEGNEDKLPEGKSSGPITFMKLYDAVGESTKSGGRVRRAAILVSMPVWHPDIMDFIRCKETDGRLANMNISVLITDKFMKALEDKVPFDLVSPYNGEKVSEIDPQELWEEISKMSWKSADPGILFIDAMNRYNPLIKQILIEATNPCIVGDTKIAVADGRNAISIKQLADEDKDIPVYCKDNTGKTVIRMMRNPRITGYKEKIYEVLLDDGSIVKCTGNHKFIMKDMSEKEAINLKNGDSLLISKKWKTTFEEIFEGSNSKSQEYWMINDGSKNNFEHRFIYEQINDVEIPKNHVIHHKDFHGLNNSIDNLQLMRKGEHDKYHDISGDKNPMRRFPEKNIFNNKEWQQKMREKNHIGATRSDETKRKIGEKTLERFKEEEDFRNYHSISVKNGMVKSDKFKNYIHDRAKKKLEECKEKTDLECFLLDNKVMIKKYCEFCGEEIILYWKRREQCFCSYSCSTKYKWNNIRKNNFVTLQNHKVISVKEIGYDIVYNGTVDDFHNFGIVLDKKKTKNGRDKLEIVYTLQCGEQPLWPFNACNLSAININKFARGVDDFDWDGLYDTTFKVMKLMDNLVDTMDFPDDDDILGRQRFRVNTLNHRPVGVGPMGLADAMYNLGYRYDGADGRKFAMEVMRIMTKACAMRSALIAKENGPFHNYEIFKEDMERIIEEHTGGDEEVMEVVKRYGVRNCQFTTCQPTGTTALSCDSSYGIEPIMGLSFQKNLISGDRMMVVNPVLEERFKNEDWYSEDLPDKIFKNGGSLKGLRGIPKEVKNVFVTAHDIKYKDRIDMQAALQKYCSTAISSTVNLSKETTSQEMADLYEYAYKRGLKGITVYRDGSKKNQPVTFSKEMKVKEFDRPKVLNAKTHCVETGNGKMYVTVSHHEGKPLELFIFLGKSGQILNTLTEAMGRVISIGLQQGVPVEEITKTLININSDRMVWYRFEDTDQRPTQILSIPDGVAKLLDRYYTGVRYNGELGGEICEKCGNFMTAMEGCFNCPACGHSKCS